MAITITAGAWASGSTLVTLSLPSSPQAGDYHVIFIGCKPYNATINVPSGWTLITNTDGANGTTDPGTDSGSVQVKAFYRAWQNGDSSQQVSITSGNTALGCIHRFRPTSGATIVAPVGEKGSDTSSGTGFSCTMGSDIGITANDAIAAYSYIAGNNSTFGSPTLSATGVTFGTVTESPSTEGSTSTGTDCEASACTAMPSAGPSSAAAVVGWTLSVAQTGMSVLVRVREQSSVSVNATTVSRTLTSYSPTINAAVAVSAGLVSRTLTAYAASVGLNTAVSAGTVARTLTAYAAGVKYDVAVSAGTVACTSTTYATGVGLNVAVSSTTVAQTLTANNATVSLHVGVGSTTVSLSSATYQPEVAIDVYVNSALIQQTLTAYNASVTAGGEDVVVDSSTVALTSATYAADVDIDVSVSSGTVACSLTAYTVGVSYGLNVSAGTQALVLTKNNPTVKVDTGIQSSTVARVLTARNATVSIGVTPRLMLMIAPEVRIGIGIPL